MALWHFLIYSICTSCLVAGQQTRYVLKGEEVSLNPGIPKTPDNILWMHKGNKVVEFNGQEEEVYNPFRNRITLDWQTAELKISNLGFEDTGDYVLEAMVDRNMHQSEFKLEVIDNVPKPTISCEVTDCSSSNMSATLVCATDGKQPQSSMKFEWSSNEKTQAGSKITIPLGEKNYDKVYTCSVSNPLSVEEATFTAKDCHSDCSSVAPIIISVIVVITLLLVILGIIYCKKYNKACFKTDDVEKQKKSGATEGSAEENEPLVNNESTSSSNQQQHQGGGNLRPNEAANGRKGDTDSDPNSAEVDDMNLQDEKPKKGTVKDRARFFETPGTKQSPEKSKDKPEETASPSPSQQSKPTSSFDQKKLVGGEEGDSDANQVGKQQTENSQNVKEPDQDEASATSGEDNPETSTSSEQPGSEMNKPDETVSPPPSQLSEPTPPSDLNNLSSSDRDDADVNQVGEEQTEDSHSDNGAAQSGVLSPSQGTESNQETSTSPEQQGSAKENKHLVNNTSAPSSDQQQHQDGSNLVSNEAANSHKRDTDSEPNSAEGLEKSKDKPDETAPSSPSQQSEATSFSDQKKLVGGKEADSDADQVGKQQTEISQNVKEPDQYEASANSGEDNPETSTSSEQPGSEMNKPEDTVSPSSSQPSEPPPPPEQNNLSSSDRKDSDPDLVGEERTEDSHSDNGAAQSGVLSPGRDTESNLETSTSPEQQGSTEANEAANSHHRDTVSDPNSAEEDDDDSQDEVPQKGHVEKIRGVFESPGTKQTPGEKSLKD